MKWKYTKPPETSKITGVYPFGSRWRAWIWVAKRSIDLGVFDEEWDAICARLSAQARYSEEIQQAKDELRRKRRKYHTEEEKKAAQRGYWKKYRETHPKKPMSVEARKRARTSHKERYATDPEFRAKNIRVAADYYKKRYATDPQFKAREMARFKARYEDPEYVKKEIERGKQRWQERKHGDGYVEYKKNLRKRVNGRYANDEEFREFTKTKARGKTYKSRLQKLVVSARMSEKKKGLDFPHTADQLPQPSHCSILGMPLDPSAPAHAPNIPSLDHILPQRVPARNNLDNIRIVSWQANTYRKDCTDPRIFLNLSIDALRIQRDQIMAALRNLQS